MISNILICGSQKYPHLHHSELLEIVIRKIILSIKCGIGFAKFPSGLMVKIKNKILTSRGGGGEIWIFLQNKAMQKRNHNTYQVHVY